MTTTERTPGPQLPLPEPEPWKRIILIDEDPLSLSGLRMLVAAAGLRCDVGQVDSIVLAPVDDTTLLLFEPPPGTDAGFRAVRQITSVGGARVAVFTSRTELWCLAASLRAGCCGFISRFVPPERFVLQLKDMASGIIAIDPGIAGVLARWVAHQPPDRWPGVDFSLSRRESEILGLLVGGLTNREIAESLVIGNETVKSHVSAVFRKLGVRDRSSAVDRAIQGGLFG